METKRNVSLWVLYDFANSLVSIVFFLYFAQWLVIDRGVSDLYFNLAFTMSAILLLLTVPTTGYLLDKFLRRISGLRFTTVLTVIFYGLCSLFAVSNKEVAALILFTLGLYSYLLSFTFYTPLLNDISKPGRRGLVSGLGIAANYLGQIAGLLIALPFANGKLSLFASAPRAETLLPAVLIFFLFSLPMLIFFKEPKLVTKSFHLPSTIKEMIIDTKLLFSFSSVSFFLLSYFLFNDAVLTAANNFPIFLEQVWHVSDTIKTYILLGILVTSALGGLISGFIADHFGHKRTLRIILFGWVFILPLIGLLSNFTLFIIAVTLMGFWFGSNWTVSRSVMAYLAPKGRHNLTFAYFGLAERASSFIGPIVWGLIASNLVSIGSDRYRVAILAVTIFIIFGILALYPVKDDRKELVVSTHNKQTL
ncbi:MAG: MFS transporter [Candidatus Woesearchaeota archaeon]|nr:MAG: MFS transporter [Candidatus Woesearchaeota archaeon]